MTMKQSYIDELLMSSDEENNAKKKPKKTHKKQPTQQENYDDDFFESESQTHNHKKSAKKILDSKKSLPSKKVLEKQKPKANKQPSQVEQQKYLQSEDFESQDFKSQLQEGDQKFNPIVKPKPVQIEPKPAPLKQQKIEKQPQEENYEVEDDFQQEIAESRASKTSKAQSQDLVKSEYTESQVHDEDIEQVADNVDEQIETVKSSKMRSQLLNDDQMSQAQSEYIESTRINQQQFKKKLDTSKQQQKNAPKKTGPVVNSLKNADMKKKKQEAEPLSGKKQAIASKKSIAQSKKASEKNTVQLNPAKGLKKDKEIQPRASKIQNSDNKDGKVGKVGQQKGHKKTPSQAEAQIQERKAKILEIQEQRKALMQKRTAKQRQEQQKAKKEYEQMKKKQEERRQKNKQLIEEKKKKEKEEGLNSTVPKDGNKRATLEKQQLQLTESKIKQLAEEEENKRKAKAKMQVTQELKKKRKLQQQQVKSKIQEQNKQKLKRLQKQKLGYMDKAEIHKKELKGKREQALKDKKNQYTNRQKQKINDRIQSDTPEIKKIKQQINQIKSKIDQKQNSISGLDQLLNQLKKQLRQKELFNYNQDEDYQQVVAGQNQDNSLMNALGMGTDEWFDYELSPVEQFVRLFDQCLTTGQIFNLIDQDASNLISLQEIKSKVTEILINRQTQLDHSRQFSEFQQGELEFRQTSLKQHPRLESLVEEVFTLLDKNADGDISKEEFTFIIDAQIKKAKEYRKLTNNIKFTNPIDIQASILDMKEKIKYMKKKSLQELSSGKMQQLQEKYRKYLSKHEQYEKRYIYGKSNTKDKQKLKDIKQKTAQQEDLSNDRHYFLTQQSAKLRLQKNNEEKMLQKIRKKQQENIKEKNLQLTQKVEQNIKLNQEIYKVNQLIEEYQLRFLSKTKIQENRYRFMSKKSEQKQLYEEAIQRAKEYQTKILNPTKEIKFGTYANQVKYLAAVIMIQRNFRMRKAIRQKQELENAN